jgi:hypothetical protein
MYLNNNNNASTQSPDDIERQKSNEKRRELIENCKHIRSIFEAEFHPHDDNVDSSYLDMNGAGMNRNQRSSSAVDDDGEDENGLLLNENRKNRVRKTGGKMKEVLTGGG